MVWVVPSTATTVTRPAITCRCSWRCAVAGAEVALHQHAVDPAAKFEPDGTKNPNLAKAEALMQADRGAIRAVADDGQDLPQSSGFAFCEQRRHQLPTNPSTGPCRVQVDRVFGGMAVGWP